ncbi:MAG: hypothetical protein LH645_02255 [Actinomycetia bacterium]|nr:hypothetical protein [Actinomycetes bacterium]
MTPTRVISVALSACFTFGLTLSLAPAASAAELTVTDPARDNDGQGLDIVSGMLDNTDYTLTGTVGFRADRDGTLIVGLKARERAIVRLVSRHRADGGGRNVLLDRRGRIACEGLVVNWNGASATATFGIPSTCLWQGNYGAVRPWFLTERLDSGTDVDFATTKEFVARG